MAAQESPVRINSLLLGQAQAAAEAFHRSVPEQISYWAELGRLAESSLTAQQISFLKSGLASLAVVEPSVDVKPSPGDLDIVALAMDGQTEASISKARAVIDAPKVTQYRASKDYPGLLERVSPSGVVDLGRFQGGRFKKASVSLSIL